MSTGSFDVPVICHRLHPNSKACQSRACFSLLSIRCCCIIIIIIRSGFSFHIKDSCITSAMRGARFRKFKMSHYIIARVVVPTFLICSTRAVNTRCFVTTRNIFPHTSHATTILIISSGTPQKPLCLHSLEYICKARWDCCSHTPLSFNMQFKQRLQLYVIFFFFLEERKRPAGSWVL